MTTFGASAPANELFKKFGFTIKGMKQRVHRDRSKRRKNINIRVWDFEKFKIQILTPLFLATLF